MNHQINQTYRRLDEVAVADVSEVEDGTYEGIEETVLVKVTVVVKVLSGKLNDVPSGRLFRADLGFLQMCQSL